MVFMSKKILFLLLVCWISFEGYADTFVPEVQTLPSVFLEEGGGGKLTCGYDRNVYAVYWRYKSATSPMKLLIVMDRYYQVGEKSGPGYEEGRFDMTDEYSLIIHNVSAKDEGRYMCEVSDLASGDAFRNYTDVTTIVKAKRPFPRIEQCEDDVPASEINATCVLHTTSNDPIFELTCTVLSAKPMAILSWTSTLASEHWKQAVNGSTLKTKGRGDGIFDQSLSVNVDTSYFTSDAEHFTCVAEGFAVDGIANQTITVYIAPDDMDDMPDKGVNVTVIAVISAGCILLFIVLIGILWKWNPCRRGGNISREADYKRVHDQIHSTRENMEDLNETAPREIDNTDGLNETTVLCEFDNMGDLNETAPREIGIETKRKKISEIEEITSKNHKPLYFGIFGSRKAETSALIDSLVYPFAEVHQKEIHKEVPPYRQTRWRQDIKRPSEFIAFCDMNDTKDIDRKAAEQLLKPISKDNEYMREGDVIHYPIFVSDIGKHERDDGDSPFGKSIALFSEGVMTSISQYPILVLTHKNPSEISNREKIISRLNLKTDIPVDNIFVIGSKKVDASTEEDEILQLLDILLQCVKNVTGGNKHSTDATDYERVDMVDEPNHNTTAIEIKKKKISDIEEITSKNHKPLYFGIFGSRKAETSALIDSLVYPFAEVHQKKIVEEVPPYRQTRWRQDIKRPSDFIAFCDMNDTKDIDRKTAEQLLEPISKDKEHMREADVIHYPIIVSDISKHEKDHGVSTYEKSVALFSEGVMTSISQYPVLVLTHKNPSEISNRERIISRLNLKTDIPVDNIFIIGSKKFDDSTEGDEILQLLDLVLKCVKNATGNISQTESKRLEIRKEIIRRNPNPIYFGIFGPTEAGKSTLIHSLIFAFTGGNYKEIPDAIPAYRDTIQRMSIKRPSKFIALCDMRKTNPKEVGQLLKPLSTDEGSMIKDDVIHYPIVVYEDGKHKTYEKSLPQLSEAVKTSISKYPVLVLTHENQSKISDREEVIPRLNSKTNIPVDNIFFTGNSTVDDTAEDGDILRLLEILLKCVKNVID